MNENKLEAIVQNLITIMPLFKKKLMSLKSKSNHAHKFNHAHGLNHSHFQILFALAEMGRSTISDVAKKLLISTPNMTKLLNKLIEVEYVERIPDIKDRRIINIEITDKGKQVICDAHKQLAIHLKDKLSSLSDEQMNKFNESLENLREVLSEMSSEE